MTFVVFLRGVNVGGHRAFSPGALARELAALEVVNIGAAGTFVVRSAATAAQVREAFVKRLAFETELMVCAGRDVTRLIESDPFGGAGPDQYVSVLAARPRRLPRLPLRVPDAKEWQVEVFDVPGRLALSRMRRVGKRILYPNEVVEKQLGVKATTRGWPTFLRIRDALR